MTRTTQDALAAVADLRKALAAIPLASPMYAPGRQPTTASACHQILEMIEFGIRQIEVLVGDGE